ncbi:hypothetical protein SeMB42_g06418 [Synchytrium endobioticum]|uniref:GRIP domain-containing protein n=1 Tax=Synchytrium endobioticum TaxID=286115 RepID=A0A507CIG6_9FUNG|nr:hypothetical protein SeMB42_g06418 [Synchytrium endobioticum]
MGDEDSEVEEGDDDEEEDEWQDEDEGDEGVEGEYRNTMSNPLSSVFSFVKSIDNEINQNLRQHQHPDHPSTPSSPSIPHGQIQSLQKQMEPSQNTEPADGHSDVPRELVTELGSLKKVHHIELESDNIKKVLLKESQATAAEQHQLIEELRRDIDALTTTAQSEKDKGLSTRVAELEAMLSDKSSALAKTEEATNIAGKEPGITSGDRLFMLEEQAKHAQIQLAAKHSEVVFLTNQLQHKSDELNKTKQEADERIKKMKGILAAANKSISESRVALGKKDSEISKLKVELEVLEQSKQETHLQIENLKATMSQMSGETLDERQLRQTQVDELEQQLRQARQETSDVKSDFSSYKVKAAAALQKSTSTASESRIRELEPALAKLERDKLDADRYADTLQSHIKELESDLDESTNQIAVLESQTLKLELTARDVHSLKQEVELLHEQLASEKEGYVQALKAKDSAHMNALETVRAEARRAMQEAQDATRRKEEESASLQHIAERLTNDLFLARDELARSRADLERLGQVAFGINKRTSGVDDMGRRITVDSHSGGKTSSLQSDESGDGFMSSQSVSSPVRHQTTFQDLLAEDRSGSAAFTSTPNGSCMREKEYLAQIKGMSDLLAESETTIQRLSEQEKILKEEIRKTERVESRKDLSGEYLKNIVLSFMEAADRSTMVPIISQMLHLSPDERERLTKAATKNTISPSDPLSIAFGWG